MKNLKKLSRAIQRSFMAGDGPYYCFEGEGPGTGGCSAGEICSGGKCIPYTDPGGGGGGGNPGGPSYTCICPWGTFIQNEPCAGPPYYCIQG